MVTSNTQDDCGFAAGDILLFGNARGSNLVITLLTHSPYYHAGIYAGEGKVIEMRTRGVVCRDLDGPDGGHYFVVIPAPEGKGPAALGWARSQNKDGYDYNDVAVILLDRVFTHLHLNYTPRNTYSCGEFVAVAFEQAGANLLPDIPIAETEPADFGRLVPAGAKPLRYRDYCAQTG